MSKRTAYQEEALGGDIKNIVSFLKDNLGMLMTTYISGRSDAGILKYWITGKESPTAVEELRLRYGYWAVKLVVDAFDDETARALFVGSNGGLGDQAPASWLRDHEKENDLKEVVGAIQSSLDGGFH